MHHLSNAAHAATTCLSSGWITITQSSAAQSAASVIGRIASVAMSVFAKVPAAVSATIASINPLYAGIAIAVVIAATALVGVGILVKNNAPVTKLEDLEPGKSHEVSAGKFYFVYGSGKSLIYTKDNWATQQKASTYWFGVQHLIPAQKAGTKIEFYLSGPDGESTTGYGNNYILEVK